jgi:hypothetical protein
MIVSFLPRPQEGGRPGIFPKAITNTWAAPQPMVGATAALVFLMASWEWFHPHGVSRVREPIGFSRALRVDDIDTFGASHAEDEVFQLTRETQWGNPSLVRRTALRICGQTTGGDRIRYRQFHVVEAGIPRFALTASLLRGS